MKRILYIETGTEGHHIEYLKGLINIKSFEVYVYTPEIICNINAKQEVHYINFKQKIIQTIGDGFHMQLHMQK